MSALVREVTSLYFSPRRKRLRSRSPSPSEERCKHARPDSSPRASVQVGGELDGEDPLYCFYFRTFGRLYKRLEQAKPLLIQERVAGDPWKVLIAVTLLNKTSGKLAIPVFWEIMQRYPEPLSLSQAPLESLESLLQPLGLHTTRSKRLVDLSKLYMDDPPSPTTLRQSRPYILSTSPASPPPSPTSPTRKTQRNRYVPTSISHLPGAGAYALDSYRIFCMPTEEWKNVMPSDKELIKYLKWKWAFEERMKWVPGVGADGRIDVEYLEKLLHELEP